MCFHVCLCVFLARVCTFVCACACVCACVCACACACACVFACACACVFACACACVCVFVRVCVLTMRVLLFVRVFCLCVCFCSCQCFCRSRQCSFGRHARSVCGKRFFKMHSKKVQEGASVPPLDVRLDSCDQYVERARRRFAKSKKNSTAYRNRGKCAPQKLPSVWHVWKFFEQKHLFWVRFCYSTSSSGCFPFAGGDQRSSGRSGHIESETTRRGGGFFSKSRITISSISLAFLSAGIGLASQGSSTVFVFYKDLRE